MHLLVFVLFATIQDIHDRLVYGSDYPVPAINLVVHTSRLQRYIKYQINGWTDRQNNVLNKEINLLDLVSLLVRRELL